MTRLTDVRLALANLGLTAQEQPKDNRLIATTNLVQFMAVESEQGLRLSCRLMQDVRRNKVSLWNVIHHNNAFLPFGQFYISPENDLCFGLQLPAEDPLNDWIPYACFHLLLVAERYYRMVQNDFAERPFNESDLQTDPFALLRADLRMPSGYPAMDFEQAAGLLEMHLPELVGPANVIRTAEQEFALTAGGQIVTATIEKLPLLANGERSFDWHIGLCTEVGVLGHTDDRLWVHFNRLNYESLMLGYGIRYANRRPQVTLKSALISPLIQYPELIQQALDRHLEVAPRLFAELESPYRLQSVLEYKLSA